MNEKLRRMLGMMLAIGLMLALVLLVVARAEAGGYDDYCKDKYGCDTTTSTSSSTSTSTTTTSSTTTTTTTQPSTTTTTLPVDTTTTITLPSTTLPAETTTTMQGVVTLPPRMPDPVGGFPLPPEPRIDYPLPPVLPANPTTTTLDPTVEVLPFTGVEDWVEDAEVWAAVAALLGLGGVTALTWAKRDD